MTTNPIDRAALGEAIKAAAAAPSTSAKKWTQADLAQKLNLKATIINDYETGKIVPDPAVISRMQAVLGVKLPKIPKKKATVEE